MANTGGIQVPKKFIELIKTMYSKAKTSVMINGVNMSSTRVDRGV